MRFRGELGCEKACEGLLEAREKEEMAGGLAMEVAAVLVVDVVEK